MRFLLAATVVLATAGCRDPADSSHGSPAAARAGSARYLALGDSFTIGTGSPVDAAFPARLAAKWRERGCPAELRNVAVNGYTTDDLIREELPELASFRPTFVTVAVGANDIVQGHSEEAYRANVRRILLEVRATGAHVVVLPQPDWSGSPAAARFGDAPVIAASIRAFNEILATEAANGGARWLDLVPLMERQAADRMLARDSLHPSAAAYAAWADSVGEAVRCPPSG